MAEDEFYKNHTDYDERVQILCASYLTVMLEYNHRKVLTLGEENIWSATLPLYGYDSEKHEVYIDPDMVEDLLNDIEERTLCSVREARISLLSGFNRVEESR